MIKKKPKSLSIILTDEIEEAQNRTISGTITDSDGTLYQGRLFLRMAHQMEQYLILMENILSSQ